MQKRTGVLLIQLGTPNSPTPSDVRPYLRQFLSDPRVIDYPWIFRILLVYCIIAPIRGFKSAKLYKELWEHGNGASPLKTITQELSDLLHDELPDTIDVHMAMRYQQPSMEKVLHEMKQKNYDKILILPLFPHYASSSAGSALQHAMRLISRWWVIPELELINQFYEEEFYIDALVGQAQKHDLSSFDHVVMSYHGLPERHVDKVYEEAQDLCAHHSCDHVLDTDNKFCYKATAYETSRRIAQKLGLESKDYTVAFQSRFDNKWLRPFTDEVIEEFAKEGKKRVLVLSPAFVADCLETIYEIGTEYQEIFTEHGGTHVQLVESCNTEKVWVDGLKEFILQRAKH